MFAWLQNEIDTIKTDRFHVFEKTTPDEGPDGVPLPPSYRRFIAEFGAARLYRDSNDAYLLIVRAPHDLIRREYRGEAYIELGSYDDNNALFRVELLREGEESPVFEYDGKQVQKTAESFDEWLRKRAAAIRKQFTRREWKQVVDGPPPFSEEELEIVEARRHFVWEFLGVGSDGNLRFRVENRSSRRLPYLTVGIRSTNNTLVGAAWLDVSDIGPGESGIVEQPVYKGVIDPKLLEPHAMPDPQPDDRKMYRELSSLQEKA